MKKATPFEADLSRIVIQRTLNNKSKKSPDISQTSEYGIDKPVHDDLPLIARMVPVNDHVLRSPSRSDQINFSITVQIGGLYVFAGH